MFVFDRFVLAVNDAAESRRNEGFQPFLLVRLEVLLNWQDSHGENNRTEFRLVEECLFVQLMLLDHERFSIEGTFFSTTEWANQITFFVSFGG